MRTVRKSPGRFITGSIEQVLPGLPEASYDAIVTDPPYGLEFMGKEWDSFKPAKGKWGDREHKPTLEYADDTPQHRAGVKQPSFLNRCLNCQGNSSGQWNRCSCGKPNMRKPLWPVQAFQSWCENWTAECFRVLKPGGFLLAFGGTRTYHRLACAIEDAGFEIRDSLHWLYGSGFPKSKNIGDGWGTALKPAHEPIIMARKPLSESTVAGNVLRHGTGALNIDGCRVGSESRINSAGSFSSIHRISRVKQGYRPTTGDWQQNETSQVSGRWPPNLLLGHSADCNGQCAADCPVAGLDAQSGVSTSAPRVGGDGESFDKTGESWRFKRAPGGFTDSGGASRFFPAFTWSPEYDLPFMYCAKAPKKERPQVPGVSGHPTVKPLTLMRWLVRLVTPPGGLILDPFAGTGTTIQAALDEGFRCTGVDSWLDAVELAKIRLASYDCSFR